MLSDLLFEMATAALDAADPRPATANAITRTKGSLEIGGFDLPEPPGIRIIAFGKAASAMAVGVLDRLGDIPYDGLVVSNHFVRLPPGLESIVAAHPSPDAESHRAGRRALELARSVPADHLVLYLVSGGGSSLMAYPADGVLLADKVRLIEHLILCGATITDLNTVRRYLSQVKGGRLGLATAGAFVTLALSDVVRSMPSDIASGPTVPSPTTPQDARRIVERHRSHFDAADSVLTALGSQQPAKPPSSPFVIVGDGATAARSAAKVADATIVSTTLEGEAREAARRAIEAVPAGQIGVFAGETTVTVTGNGVGGRNQEAAVAAALAISGREIAFMALGTDGIDGPTPAAGGIVDGTTAAMARANGVDLPGSLASNDSNTALTALGCAIIMGPTGTNVGDLWIIDRRET